MGSEAQGGPLALRHHRSPDHLLCLLSMVARCQTASTKNKLSKVHRLACLGIAGALRTTPTGAMEVLLGLPPLDLVIHGEARSAAYRLCSLRGWSYLQPQRGHSCILARLQKSDPILIRGSTL